MAKNKKVRPEDGPIRIAMNKTDNGYEVNITPFEKTQHVKKNGEDYILVDGNDQPVNTLVSFDKQKVVLWIEEGKIDQSLGQTIIKAFDKHEHRVKLIKDAAGKEDASLNQQIADLLETNIEEDLQQVAAMRQMIAIKESLKNERTADRMNPLFKKNVDHETSFGVTKALTDRLNYLPELLQNATLKHPQEGTSTYKIIASLSPKSAKGIGPIGLEHTLQYKEHVTSAEETAKEYLKDMGGEALRVFLAYWAYANKQEAFCYSANITDVMAMMSDPKRASYFSVKEKRRFWELSQLLEKTNLTITIKHKYKYKQKYTEKCITVKHPFLNLSVTASRKKNQENDEGYPDKMVARVLNPDEFRATANLATAISKATTRLPTNDIMLALSFQTRGSQRRGFDSSEYDEEYLISQAGLQKTQEANPQVARKRLAEKIKRIERADGIDGFQKKVNGKYIIKQRSSRKQKPTKI